MVGVRGRRTATEVLASRAFWRVSKSTVVTRRGGFLNSMATNRLRTTFKYLADDSEDDNYPYDLDEEGKTPLDWAESCS